MESTVKAYLMGLSLTLALTLQPLKSMATDDTSLTLKKGDRIVFLGDSITQAGWDSSDGYVQIIKKTLDEKHKSLDISVLGAGISGNKVPDLQKRVDRDVIAKKPTIVFIYIGINDVWHGESNPANGTSKDIFKSGLKEVIKKITDSGAKVVVCTPSVIGEKKNGANKLDKQLDEYSDISRAIAKELNLPLCDLRKEFVNYEMKNNKTDKESGLLTSDRVHLNQAGNKFVADTMLKVLGN